MGRMPALQVLEYIRDDQGVWSLPLQHVDALRAEFPSVCFSTPADQAAADRLLPEADVVFGWAVNPDNFASAKRLQWIQVTAAGLGRMLFRELVESPVIVTNGRGLHSVSMAEHTIGVILSFARKLHLARDAQGRREWAQTPMWKDSHSFVEVAGTTLGMVGVGSIGREIAWRARALGIRVIAVRRHAGREPRLVDAQWGPEGLPTLLAESDWVVVAAPLTNETRGLIGAAELGQMKREAILINLGRGAIVDEAALEEALANRTIAGAGLDVFEHEPLRPDSPLWTMPNVLVTPHVSGTGPRYWERATELMAGNLRRFIAGQPLANVVDKRAGY